jgi:HAD superfamily hydrolase (TIGR01509 family)
MHPRNIMKAKKSAAASHPAFLFDLDGTLIDSVYEHTLAWREALEEMGIGLPTVSIHRRIGMSRGMLVHAFEREAGKKLTSKEIEHLQTLHSCAYKKRAGQVRPLPGAHDLLQELSNLGVAWAIATSGRSKDAKAPLAMLRLGPHVPVITRDDVKHAKPEPDLFLTAAAKLKFGSERCVVVGDSIWDLLAAQRARMIGVGLLSGGFGENELERAGAYRVYRDPADLLAHLDEVGVRGV